MYLQGGQTTLFSDDPWKVQIRLRAEDEEVCYTFITHRNEPGLKVIKLSIISSNFITLRPGPEIIN